MLNILIIGIFLAPIILLSILEVNSVVAFLSLCLGAVASLTLNKNVFIEKYFHSSNYINHITLLNNLKLVLLLLPLVVIIILMVKTAKGGLLSINTIGAIATGVLLTYLLIPILPSSLTSGINHNNLWLKIQNQESNAIGISALVVLVLLVLQRGKFSHKGGLSKHKK